MGEPSASHSDNLNPWLAKFERAPRRKNTEPVAKVTENTFAKGEALETEYVLVPAGAHNKLEGYVPVDRLIAKQILDQAPAVKQSALSQERAEATPNCKTGLAPLAIQAELVREGPAPVAQNAGNALAPIASTDKLEGYEERYFLKEDGRDDVS